MYDLPKDADSNPYFPTEIFTGYQVRKVNFIRDMVRKGIRYDRIILSHINLLSIGHIIKKISPKTQLVLLAHGIEVWSPLSPLRRKMLRSCDQILAVSQFTLETMIKVHGLPAEKLKVLNNCLDPFLKRPAAKIRSEELLTRYGLKKTDKILMTLTRLNSKERYKGYDRVMQAMALLRDDFPEIKYLIVGKYDQEEQQYIVKLQQDLGLTEQVVLTGFIPDEELESHFNTCDVYVMPSRKEGFGLVFIEAMYYNLPVIAGNKDGSTDALLNGELGQLVDPENVEEIAAAIERVLRIPEQFLPNRKLMNQYFSYESYKRTIEDYVFEESRQTQEQEF